MNQEEQQIQQVNSEGSQTSEVSSQGSSQQKVSKKKKEKKPPQPTMEEKLREEIKSDPLNENYGEPKLIQSQEQTNRTWYNLEQVNESLVGQNIWVRARIQSVTKVSNKLCFIILREKYYELQVFLNEQQPEISRTMIKWASQLPNESVIEVFGKVFQPEEPIRKTTQQVEIIAQKVFCISKSVSVLPFQIKDASQPLNSSIQEENEETKSEQFATVGLNVRLNNRVLEMRTKANQAIFTIQSGVCQLFREFLYQNKFMEIHTPKLIGGQSEGGANVFKLEYFGKQACLAQSPQLYKQMAVMAGFSKVFEIGPVFRAENATTHRHLCEFTGLDFEMAIKESYMEILEFAGELFGYIFKGLEERYKNELEEIKKQFPFEPFKFKTPVVKLTFEEGCKLLKEAGVEQSPYEDLSTEVERKLGAIVREKYETDFYMLHKFPMSARPFYTMPCSENPEFSNSYDFFMRGEEIVSGAQRIHEPELLAKRATECGVGLNSIKSYVEAFKYGAYPHGGVGVGLERVVMLFLNLGNVRRTSMFPRDPTRLYP